MMSITPRLWYMANCARSFPVFLRRVSLPRLTLILSLPCVVAVIWLASSHSKPLLLVGDQSSPKALLGRQDWSLPGVLHSVEKKSYDGGIPVTTLPTTTTTKTVVVQPEQKCVLPTLKVDDPLMLTFVKRPRGLVCPSKPADWVSIKNGTLVYSPLVKAELTEFSCDLYPLIRPKNNDNNILWGDKVANFPDGGKIPHDFVKVHCRQNPKFHKPLTVRPVNLLRNNITAAALAGISGAVTPPGNSSLLKQQPKVASPPPSWEDILIGVSPHNSAVWRRLKEVKPPPNGLSGLSVLMLGFDSMSRMSWYRRMPATRKFLVESLSAVELEGYNIMGDGTPAALFPILTVNV